MIKKIDEYIIGKLLLLDHISIFLYEHVFIELKSKQCVALERNG